MSSHSTTATTTYVLQKYSRSYPSTKENNNSEWQHFTNPTIRLVLDIKKSSDAKLESVRLRIIWSMNASNDDLSDRNEVVFEDIDLLSFSSLSSCNQAQGLPLKAVYRDSIVGIRYLISRDTSNASYRRFQIAFVTASEASQFIDSISSVCPCKNNPAPVNTTQITQYSSTIPAATGHPSLAHYPTRNTPVHQSESFRPLAKNIRPAPTFVSASPPSHAERSIPSLAPPQVVNPTPYSQPNLPGSFWSASGPALHPEFPSSQNPTGALTRAQPPTLSGVAYGRQAITQDALVNVQFAKPTGPATGPSAVSSQIGPSLSNTSLVDKATQTSDPLFSALRDATSLYNLSHESLEKLVGDVVREDGFIGLMEHLSTMWKIKGYTQIY
ncbi:hypothetical protein VKT23_000759 [Stygiomarasmius scandens]|uniref:Uncharacterized protein n=1 Tax=Marasmiellus scandens TaxID=2682957 RepID=A0ABR1K530_9AGAR